MSNEEIDAYDAPDWFEIVDRATLFKFSEVFGETALEDELYDWDRADLIDLIKELAGSSEDL